MEAARKINKKEQQLKKIDITHFCSRQHFSIIRSEAGASPNHNLIVSNIMRTISDFHTKLCCFTEGNEDKREAPPIVCTSCINVFPSDVYIKNLYRVGKKPKSHYFSDIVIVKGPIKTSGRFITNPKIAIEVFSPGNKHIEMMNKLKSFSMFPSFEEFIVVQSESKNIASYKRTGQWQEVIHDADFDIESLDNYPMKFDDVYFKWNDLETKSTPRLRLADIQIPIFLKKL